MSQKKSIMKIFELISLYSVALPEWTPMLISSCKELFDMRNSLKKNILLNSENNIYKINNEITVIIIDPENIIDTISSIEHDLGYKINIAAIAFCFYNKKFYIRFMENKNQEVGFRKLLELLKKEELAC